MVHETHWERLASLDPADVCRRSGAEHDAGSGCYTLPLLERRIEVDPATRSLHWVDERGRATGEPERDAALLAVVYLNEAKALPPVDDWVTPESLPTGAFFFRGFHAIPTPRIAEGVGHDRDVFLQAGRALGGEEVGLGDACIQLQVLPRVPVRLVLWMGDDEFRSRVTMLVDRLVHEHLPLDAIYGMSLHLTAELLRAAEG